MSTDEKIAFWVWTGVVLAVGIVLITVSVTPEEYVGDVAQFNAGKGHILKVQQGVKVEAGGNKYFRLVQEEEDQHFYGKPEEPPLDYGLSEYFYAQGKLSPGEWKVVDGNAELRIEPAEEETAPITVRRTCSGGKKATNIGIGALVMALVWALGLFLGWSLRS